MQMVKRIKSIPHDVSQGTYDYLRDNLAERAEVVIKIPKYYLTHPQDYSCLAECVRRGVQLPKELGRRLVLLQGVEAKAESEKMADNIFEKLTDEEKDHLWMYIIFNRDKIKAKTEQWTKEAEKRGMTLTEYLESINPLEEQ